MYDNDEVSATVFGVDMGSFRIRPYRGNNREVVVAIPSVMDNDVNDNGSTANKTQNTTQTVQKNFHMESLLNVHEYGVMS